MERVERICRMETIMDQVEAALESMKTALDGYEALQAEIEELEQYYQSSTYMEDLAADAAGKLPDDLKRGVLSEDGLWNLLADRDGLLCRMEKLGK